MPPPANIFNPAGLSAAIDQANARFARLLLVVGRSGIGKTTLIQSMVPQYQLPLLNLGLELSQKLLGLTARERKLTAADLIADLVAEQATDRIAIDNTEIIFDPALMLNPLGLLQNLARGRLVVWSWNGSIVDGNLTYAHPGHPEYQRLPLQDLTLVALE